MFNVKYLAMRRVQMHAGAKSKLLYGFACVNALILYNTMDYRPLHTQKAYSD